MDTVLFDLLKLGYHLALAVIVGGGLVLAAGAPAIFKAARTRGEGGAIFGAVLARYDGLAVFALLIVGITTALKLAAFETFEGAVVVRIAALGLMAAATLYASAWANPIARSLRAQTQDWDSLPENTPVKREFGSLHRRSTRAMSLAILAGLVALYLS